MKKIAVVLIILAAAVFANAEQKGSAHSIQLPDVKTDLKAGEGKDITERFCIICHSLDYITMQPKFTKAQWTAEVDKMIKVMGAPVPEKEAGTIKRYLAGAYGKGD